MEREQLERYSRHILLPDIDIAGQERLLASSVLIVGLGGLGSPAAMYLAGSGVGHLLLNDHDVVDLGNLQRQIIHGTPDVGRAKTASARDRLQSLNPDIRVSTLDAPLAADSLARTLGEVDLVLDATDNFPTRFALNAACIATGTPLVWGAAIRLQGHATTFDFRRPDSPCLACLYPEPGQGEDLDSCAERGVFAPVPGIIGCLMAAEALKLLLGLGDTLCGRLVQFNAATMDWRESRLHRDPHCTLHKL